MAEDNYLLIYLFVALVVKINARLFLFFLRQPNEVHQPLLEVIEYPRQGGEKAAQLLRIGFLSMEESLHSCLLGYGVMWFSLVAVSVTATTCPRGR